MMAGLMYEDLVIAELSTLIREIQGVVLHNEYHAEGVYHWSN